jgi:hypothetical protein
MLPRRANLVVSAVAHRLRFNGYGAIHDMKRLEWSTSLRVLALLVTAFWIASAVLQAVLQFHLTGAPPERGSRDFLDFMEASFQFETDRWPIDFAATALVGLGFLSLGGLGTLLSRLADVVDARRSLGAAVFVGAGLLGASASLIWLAVKPFATYPHYCDCGLRAEEIMSRLIVLNTADAVQLWFTIGAIMLGAVGFLFVAGLGERAGMSRNWVMFTYLTAVLGLLAAVLGALDVGDLADLTALAVAGILVPIWTLWLAIRAPQLTPPDGTTVVPPIDSGA